MRILILAILLAFSIQNGTTTDFDYKMFENFQVCAAAFKDEAVLVPKLLKMKSILKDKADLLLKLKQGQSNLHGLRSNREEYANIKESVPPLEKEFGNFEDVLAAQRGLLVLIDTYNLSIKNLMRGIIVTSNSYASNIPPSGVRSSTTLALSEVIQLAMSALELGWYDQSIKLVKVAKDVWETNDLDNNPLYKNHPFLEALREDIKSLYKNLPQLNNNFLSKKKYTAGNGFKVLPYMVDENLKRKSKQPKFLKTRDIVTRENSDREASEGNYKENRFRRICGGDLVGKNVTAQGPQICRYLDHGDPYLKLGPFKLEIVLKEPFRSIFHDFFSESEIQWLIDYSTPRLSRERGQSPNNIGLNSAKRAEGYTRTIHKTVQTWIPDRIYNESMQFDRDDLLPLELKDPYSYYVEHQVLEDLGKKIELASQMTVRERTAASQYQVTNYGLGGLCETHVDPHGYIEGKKVQWHQRHLKASGDMIATFMGWLDHVKGGGGTAFDYPEYEQLVKPTRGSAAFWFDLKSNHHREGMSSHGGCPVLIGSKWILNKWIMSFDQTFKYPSHLEKLVSLRPDRFI